ncbi:glycosyltransferase family 25 protein [Alloyangia pacifica]|uniref:Glycosyltransferase family 25 (LPS biosynthesis protein) n=1 Tax=Alloyangia pacifica TaxID=311180 RepID=A0A1I6P5P6_9RHOB|nr:glycosyltransferase family 25 protein [Alloyangia pacifica]SDG19841.1 Glycosyltransferase family 25 (LPS biosynthesis protein) [Alloyangia pacifica]SFS35505.1 Glycosyltransferase family 25 (LPS biosynthesis protein) [Alloyangia pacifica]
MRESQIAVFLAHRALWETCDQLDEPIVIFEHDATLLAPIGPPRFRYVLNLQRTSWDDPGFRYHTKMQALVDAKRSYGSAKYICLPGAAAYAITPEAARILLRIRSLLPADLFVNKYLLEIDDDPALPATVGHDFSLNI